MGDVVFHAGTFKTGTTQAQNAMQANAELLRRAGVGFPDYTRSGNHTEYYVAVCQKFSVRHSRVGVHTKFDQKRLTKRLLKAGSAMSRAYGTSLLSTEYVAWLDADELRLLRELLLKSFGQVRIVMFLRRQDYSISSHWSQQLRSGGSNEPTPENVEELIPLLDHQRTVQRWTEVFGESNVTFLPFLERYKSANSTAVASQLLATVGFSYQSAADSGEWVNDVERENESLSAEAAAYLRLLNPYVPRVTADGVRNDAQRKRLCSELSAEFPGTSVRVGPELGAFVAQRYFPANDLLRPRLQGPLWDEWYDQPPARTGTEFEVSKEDLARIMAKLGAPNGPITWHEPLTETPRVAKPPRVIDLRSVKRLLKSR